MTELTWDDWIKALDDYLLAQGQHQYRAALTHITAELAAALANHIVELNKKVEAAYREGVEGGARAGFSWRLAKEEVERNLWQSSQARKELGDGE